MVSNLRPFSLFFRSKKHTCCSLVNSVKIAEKYVVKTKPKNQKMTPKNTVFGEKMI